MTGKDLLIGLGDISHKYYEEAENGTMSSSRGYRSFRRPMLVAAIIALTALLVGCAVVYALRLQDMSIGQETYTQNFDDEGRAIEPTEKTRDILTMYGHSGDPIQLALTEWYEFLNTYDPDGKLSTNDPDLPDIPDQYEYIYSCYTQDMVKKVDEIAGKYDLKLLETRIPFQHYQSDIFLTETGINSLVLPNSGAETDGMAGMLYLPGNFNMEFSLKVEGMAALFVGYSYTRKDYFPRDFPGGGLDLNNYEQWDHTASDGTQLLLALSNKGHGIIIAEPENAMINISVSGNFSGSSYPDENEIITKDELEIVADFFDYSIKPQAVDLETVEAQLKEAEAAYQAEHTYVPETYGSFNEYLKETIRIPDDTLQYTFHDMNGDGEDDLLIGRNGAYDRWITIRDGETRERMVMDTYFCEGNVTEQYDAFEIYETHTYIAPISDTVIDDIDAELKVITVLRRERDQWSQGPNEFDQKEITAEEAQNVMAQYNRVELDWQPLMDYPLSEGYTLQNNLDEKDIRVSDGELLNIYKKYMQDLENMHYSHYRILDINADGVDDLLLKGEDNSFIGNTDFYWIALTYRYGVIEGFASDFYLCENDILEKVSTRQGGAGVEKDGHHFMRCIGFEEERYELVVYNKATVSWFADWQGDDPISEDEANAILAKYPRIDQGMRPISELLN